MAELSLVGVWRLRSFELHDEQGNTTYPYSENVDGYLIYTADSHMAVSYAPVERTHFSVNDPMVGSDEEKIAAFETFQAYFGRYDLEADRVIHHVEVSLFPNRKNTDLIRFYRLEGNRLELVSAPAKYRGKTQTAHLVWERAA